MCLSHKKTLKDSFEHKGNPKLGLRRENGGRNEHLAKDNSSLKNTIFETFHTQDCLF